jgi:hypothetical protein
MYLTSRLDQAYPKPNKKGWEQQYIYAKALDEQSTELIEFIKSLRSQGEAVAEQEKDKTDINES